MYKYDLNVCILDQINSLFIVHCSLFIVHCSLFIFQTNNSGFICSTEVKVGFSCPVKNYALYQVDIFSSFVRVVGTNNYLQYCKNLHWSSISAFMYIALFKNSDDTTRFTSETTNWV